MIKQIKPEIAKQWLESKEACIIDVREHSEHQHQSIKGSCLIPIGQISEDKIPHEFRDKKIILHCQRGGRSSRACTQLLSENPALDIYNLEGGILGWSERGLETSRPHEGAKFSMSIERQVRLTAGLLVFVGCLLTFFVNFNFIALPAFIGFGLMFTAIIDWCGMAKFLSKMPWNK